jgi:hypothetical protein
MTHASTIHMTVQIAAGRRHEIVLAPADTEATTALLQRRKKRIKCGAALSGRRSFSLRYRDAQRHVAVMPRVMN